MKLFLISWEDYLGYFHTTYVIEASAEKAKKLLEKPALAQKTPIWFREVHEIDFNVPQIL